MDLSFDPIAGNARPSQRLTSNPSPTTQLLVDPTSLATDRDPRERATKQHTPNSEHHNSKTAPPNSPPNDNPSNSSIDFLT